MLCAKCGANAVEGFTIDVTEVNGCLVIVRNVPCWECTECNEVIYTGDVLKRLESIKETAKKLMQDISVIDYAKVA